MEKNSINIILVIKKLKTEILFILKEVYNYKNGKNLVEKLVKQYLDLNQPKEDYGLVIGGYSWYILGFENDKLLLITENIIRKMPYHNKKNFKPTWETCSLRKYLNTKFYESFNDDEKAIICTTELGNSIFDKIFLLSIDEFKKYFRHSALDRFIPDFANWWLRSPGVGRDYNAKFILCDGTVMDWGASVETKNGVRPAMWISLSDSDTE